MHDSDDDMELEDSEGRVRDFSICFCLLLLMKENGTKEEIEKWLATHYVMNPSNHCPSIPAKQKCTEVLSHPEPVSASSQYGEFMACVLGCRS